MKLISLMQLLPLRNEKGEVYKWTEIHHLINPANIQRIRHEPMVDHTVIRFMNGEEMIIEDSLAHITKKFEEACL